MGRTMGDGVGWRYDIQHIAAQTRALRTRGLPQAVVVYLEADGKSWPSWRAKLGYPRANARIVEIVDQLRTAIGNPPKLSVTLTGHSGGGSFMFGFIEGQDSLPPWLTRIAFLDANYNFAPPHGDKLVTWLKGSAERRLIVLAYDDREIMLDGKKVVSDSGGTWRASQRMIENLTASGARHIVFVINETKHQLIGYMGSGRRFGCQFSYVVQEDTNGQHGSTSPGPNPLPDLVLVSSVDTGQRLDLDQAKPRDQPFFELVTCLPMPGIRLPG